VRRRLEKVRTDAVDRRVDGGGGGQMDAYGRAIPGDPA
jgi:hypothetical protein